MVLDYFPGIWIYFMGADFDVSYKIIIDYIHGIDSSLEGITIVDGAVKLELHMSTDEKMTFHDDDDELILAFKTEGSHANFTFDIKNELEKEKIKVKT
jgi:hypothetical protein